MTRAVARFWVQKNYADLCIFLTILDHRLLIFNVGKSENMNYTDKECQEFVKKANPLSWLINASYLHSQVVILKRERDKAIIFFKKDGESKYESFREADKAIFLLCSFVIENLLKSFLIYENPDLIKNGKLDKKIKTHSLTLLCNKSNLVPYKNKYKGVIKEFEEGNMGWMRYPCGKDIKENVFNKKLSSRLWKGYINMINFYEGSLIKLMRKGWKNPCDGSIFYGNFEGEFF